MPHAMFRRRENWVEEKINEHAEKTGWRVRKFVSPGRRGEADRMYTKKLRFKILEIKRPGEEPTKLQLKRLNEWAEDGFETAWVDNVEDGCAFLDR